MDLYVFFVRTLSGIGGAELYLSRKIEYLEKKGWKTLVFYYENKGKCIIPNLLRFKNNFFYQLRLPVGNSKQSVRKRIIDQITKHNASKIIVESFTPELAVWGEYISKMINGKHIIYLIDEELSPLTNRMKDFLLFKINQQLLFCIKGKVISNSLGISKIPYKTELAASGCNYGNVEDIRNNVVESLESDKINIVSIGRLEKPYMPNMVKSVISFCRTKPYIRFNFIFVGDTRVSKVKELLFKDINETPNVTLVELGYTWPIPRALFKKADVILASAGSARVGHQEGVPTICIDSKDHEAIGLFGINTENTLFRGAADQNKKIFDYLNEIIIEKKYGHYNQIRTILDYSDHQNIIDADFDHKYYIQILKRDFLNHILARKIIIKLDNIPIFAKIANILRQSKIYRLRYKI